MPREPPGADETASRRWECASARRVERDRRAVLRDGSGPAEARADRVGEARGCRRLAVDDPDATRRLPEAGEPAEEIVAIGVRGEPVDGLDRRADGHAPSVDAELARAVEELSPA